MKFLKYILFGILGLILLLVLIAAIAPKEMKAESEIIIDQPQSVVYDYIKLVKNQDEFGKWQLMDPNMKTTSTGVDGTEGFIYRWDSEVLNQGSQKITKVDEGVGIETELDFGFGEPAQSYLKTVSINPNQTKVIWGMNGKSQYPYNLLNLVYKMDKDFQEGLENLKRKLEHKK